MALDVESLRPACNKEFESLFSVKSSEVALLNIKADSQSQPESV